jgi:hypothetical protein
MRSCIRVYLPWLVSHDGIPGEEDILLAFDHDPSAPQQTSSAAALVGCIEYFAKCERQASFYTKPMEERIKCTAAGVNNSDEPMLRLRYVSAGSLVRDIRKRRSGWKTRVEQLRHAVENLNSHRKGGDVLDTLVRLSRRDSSRDLDAPAAPNLLQLDAFPGTTDAGGSVRPRAFQGWPQGQAIPENVLRGRTPMPFDQREALRVQLKTLYSYYNPAKVADVDRLLEKYRGLEDLLFMKVVLKYSKGLRRESEERATRKPFFDISEMLPPSAFSLRSLLRSFPSDAPVPSAEEAALVLDDINRLEDFIDTYSPLCVDGGGEEQSRRWRREVNALVVLVAAVCDRVKTQQHHEYEKELLDALQHSSDVARRMSMWALI